MTGDVFKRIKCPHCGSVGAFLRFKNDNGNHIYECASCGEKFQRDYGKTKGGQDVESKKGLQGLLLDDVEQ